MVDPPLETVWSPVELTLRAHERHANPYTDVAVAATFEHESGTEHVVPGFPDGEATWRVRFAPTEPGEWSYRIENDAADPGLTDQGVFEAVGYRGSNPIKRHGFLETDGRRIVHDDGTPVFWLADTAWSAGAKASAEEWDRYLTARREQGFNVVQINALPQHDASQPWDRLPFGANWTLDRPDPDYFRALDDLVAIAHERGFVPALVALWFNYAPGARPNWDDHQKRHPMDESQAARWGRYLAARYGAFGAVWLVSGDTNYDEDNESALDVYDAAAEAIGEGVTHPMRTAHMVGGQSTPPRIAEREWLEFHIYQSGHVTDRALPVEMAVECRSRDGKPVINGEPPYENLGYPHEDGIRVPRRACREAAWLSVLSGANAGVTYGGHGVWQWHRPGEHFEAVERIGMPDPWTEAIDLPGARDYGRLAAFLSRHDVGSLRPLQDVLVDDPPLARAAEIPEDDVLLVYVADGAGVTLEASALEDTHPTWIDPATMEQAPAAVEIDDGTVVVSQPPWQRDSLLYATR